MKKAIENISEFKTTFFIGVTGFIVVVIMFSMIYKTSQDSIKGYTTLVDAVMQLRVDIPKTHQLIHSSMEDKHVAIVDLPTQINLLRSSLNGLGTDNEKLRRSIFSDDSTDSLIESSKRHIEKLLTYLHDNEGILGHTVEEDEAHDMLFESAERAAVIFDEVVHKEIVKDLSYQQDIFLFTMLFSIIYSLLILNSFNKARALANKSQEKSLILAHALEASGESVIIADKSGVIEFVNSSFCSMSGYTEDDVLGRNPSLMGSGLQSKEFYDNLWKTINKGKVWRGEIVNKKKDGTLYQSLMSVAPMVDKDGYVTRYVANQKDVTETRTLDEKVFESQKLEAVGALAGGLAHDFNNALAALIGNIYLLRRCAGDQEKVIKRADMMDSICESTGGHMKQMLSYARDNSITSECIEINSSVKKMVEVSSSWLPASIDLKYSSTENEIHVLWSDSQIENILINIVNNAVQALSEKPDKRIEIVTKIILNEYPESIKGDNIASLSVKDNGSGMKQEILDKIFQPFFTTKEHNNGTGLGLSMAKESIHRLGGKIVAGSKEGVGTEVIILLPLDCGKNTSKERPSEHHIYRGNGETILLADDEPYVLRMQKDLITSFGYNVITASDGPEVCRLYDEHKQDIYLIILDMEMPRLTGIKAAYKIREANKDIPVMLSTAYEQKDINNMGKILSNVSMLYKPFNPSTISHQIYKALS